MDQKIVVEIIEDKWGRGFLLTPEGKRCCLGFATEACCLPFVASEAINRLMYRMCFPRQVIYALNLRVGQVRPLLRLAHVPPQHLVKLHEKYRAQTGQRSYVRSVEYLLVEVNDSYHKFSPSQQDEVKPLVLQIIREAFKHVGLEMKFIPST